MHSITKAFENEIVALWDYLGDFQGCRFPLTPGATGDTIPSSFAIFLPLVELSCKDCIMRFSYEVSPNIHRQQTASVLTCQERW